MTKSSSTRTQVSIQQNVSHAPTDATEQATDAAADDGRIAWTSVQPTLAQMPEALVATPTVDVFEVTDRVRQLHALIIADPALVARFRKQSEAGEFDLACLTDLPTRCLAASYAQGLFVKARGGTTAKVPKATIVAASAVCARMKALAVYLFSKHAEESAKVTAILAGRGYRDLADDLHELAALYRRHPEYVSRDPVNYLASDVADAERYAREITAALGRDPTQRRSESSDLSARAWTLFWRSWSEVAQLGRWLLRESPERSATLFPMVLAEFRASPQTSEPPAKPTPEPTPANPTTTK